jgi:FKBP-type peptidyl-prolyl cis-trans isomerase FklB
MHVGDSVEVVIPYQLGYGTTITGSIPPYSMLKFNMRLVDIPYYQARP